MSVYVIKHSLLHRKHIFIYTDKRLESEAFEILINMVRQTNLLILMK